MIERIAKNSDIVKRYHDLLRTNSTKYIITDDISIIEQAFIAKKAINSLLYVYDIEYKTQTKDLLQKLIQTADEVYEISLKTFTYLANKENSCGIIAIIENEVEELEAFSNRDFLVVLDHLEIPGNVGTIYRTMDSASVDGLLYVDGITKIHNSKITQSARGSNLFIPSAITTYAECVQFLEENGYDIYLGEPVLGSDYQSYDYKGKIAIVVGNERFGINPDWYNHTCKKVFIPMEGHNNSLNVGVAASILIYEAFMKRKK